MTTDEALQFLAQHSPLPDDGSLSDDLIDRYDEVRRVFLANRDARCVGPLLRSFGDGSGFGVYQLIEDVIAQFPEDVVIPELEGALASSHPGVKYWSSQIVSRFPSAKLVDAIVSNLRSERSDVRSVSADALSFIGDRRAMKPLVQAMAVEAEDDVRNAIQEAISALGA